MSSLVELKGARSMVRQSREQGAEELISELGADEKVYGAGRRGTNLCNRGQRKKSRP